MTLTFIQSQLEKAKCVVFIFSHIFYLFLMKFSMLPCTIGIWCVKMYLNVFLHGQ